MSKLGHALPATAPETGPASDGGSRRRRAVAAAVALLVALGGFGLAIAAFRRSGEPIAATASNGRIAFASLTDTGWQILTVDPDGTNLTRLIDLSTSQFHPAWSPDGSRIAFDVQESIEESHGRMEIDVMDADGTNVQTLTDGPDWNYLPAWSPDGTRIAFVSDRDGNNEIYVMNADGSDQTRLTDDPEEDLVPDWSPDGSRIAFQSNRDANNEIYVMNPDGSNLTNLTHTPTMSEFDPAWSPDGGRIAFAGGNGNTDIYVMNADGSRVSKLTDDSSHDWSPAWSPDGTRIAFESDRNGRVGIYVMNADGTGIHRLIDALGEACCPAWQPVPFTGQTPTLSGSPSPAPTPSPVDPVVSATIRVGEFPNAVAAGEGGIWVCVPTNDGSGSGDILRIDPTTNEVVARIPIEAVPTWETGGGGLAVGAGSVWVTDTVHVRDQGPEAVLRRIDPTTNRVAETIPLDGGSGADVAVAGDSAWVLVFDGPNSMAGVRVDLATDQVVARIPVPGIWGQEIFATIKGVFVNTRDPFPGEDSTVGASRLTMIDPATN